MILTIGVVGLLIFTAIWFGLDNIKIELRYRNTLIKEQNQILKEKLSEFNAIKKALTIPLVGNHVFCPHCGDKRQLKVETDLNSGRVCKSRLCKGK